ncbi:hypothetical protein K3495_g1489 [Podosphaera aphanis]|nr:hypothetical protein K3495_g1489 [Podosphaera aphanis]
MQTDDTLILGCKKFAELEDSELKIANLTAKPKEELSHNTPLIFNGCVLSKENGNINLCQKEQGSKLKIIDPKSPFCNQEYIEQRARGAYLATICQPEASFDLSTAAQQRQPDEKAIITLNKRLHWQMQNLNRGIRYVPLKLDTVKIFVFVDGSFANNQDLSSQLGYLIIMANEIDNHDSGYFDIHGNLIHWSSVKSKRVTRSVLASEIYGMVNDVDMAIAINTTMEIIMNQLSLIAIPIIVCTDSFSLYQCLVKLGTTNEKRLMIDIMALRQFNERRELQEIRWINGHDSPADAMTKSNPNRSLEKFLDSNQLRIRIEGWVDRE